MRKKKIAVFLTVLLAAMPFTRTPAQGDPAIYGSVINAKDWATPDQAGIYSFPTSGEAAFTPVKLAPGLVATGGGCYADSKYYSIHGDSRTLHIYDADTWREIEQKPISNLSLDMTYDPATGNIYACYIDNGAALGVLKPETGTFEHVADFYMQLVALFCSDSGRLYGIGIDGCLYSIDKATGETSLIGSTGLYPMFAQSATISPNTGKCYWAAVMCDMSAGLYEIDLATAEARLITGFPNGEEITGLFILPEAAPDAPATVSGLTADFAGGNTQGSVSFTMPSATNNGQALAGPLQYKILVNGQATTGTAQPGQKVTESFSLATGMYKFAVSAANGNGESATAAIALWVGVDTPAGVSNIRLEKLSETKVKLSWEAPEKGINGGYINTEALTYKIMRYPGNVLVSESYHGTELTEDIPATKLAKYWYVVTPLAEGAEGAETSSGKVIAGNAGELPYTEDFSTTSGFGLFTTADANADGKTWFQELYSETAQYGGDSEQTADDWLFTPPVKLTDEGFYKLTFQARCNSQNTHRLEVALGRLPYAKDMSSTVLPPTDISTEFNLKTIEAKFFVEKASDYYLGFHITSGALTSSFDIDNIKLERISSVSAPGGVIDFSVKPAEQGRLQAEVAFNTPTTTIAGGTLGNISKVELLRDGKLINTFAEAAPGARLTFTDNTPANGFNTYTAITYNGAGTGNDISAKAYIGIDVPDTVRGITAREVEYGKVELSWEAPLKGVNGGYINPAGLKYTVKRNGWLDVASGTEELRATDIVDDLGNSQRTIGYSVYATSEGGDGPEGYSPYIAAGIPYEMPVKESFATGMTTYEEWASFPVMEGGTWRASFSPDNKTQDSDYGMIAFSTYEDIGRQTKLMSPKIRIDNTVSPVLEFWVYNSSIHDEMAVEIYNDSYQAETVKYIDLEANTGTWTKHTVDLAPFKSSKYVQLGVVTDNVTRNDQLNIDNISFTDNLRHNLAAKAIKAPKKIETGTEKEILLCIANYGSEKAGADSYTVDFYNKGKLISSVQGKDIEPGQEETVIARVTPQASDLYNMEICAIVNYAEDENSYNNTSASIDVAIVAPAYPTVTDLSGTDTGKEIALSWTAPDISNLPPAPFTDNLESYEPFTVSDLGDWTLVDGDKKDISMEFRTSEGEWITYPNSGGAMSYQIIDLSQINGSAKDGWTSMSGNKIILTPYSGVKDDWMISPELAQVEQTVTLYAKSLNYGGYGLESFSLMYSATDKETASFKELEHVSNIPIDWTEYSFKLPESAKYFAIRTDYTNSALLLDDISFVPASATPLQLEVEGYNVYRNGRKINGEPVAGNRYADAYSDTDVPYTYTVTVVYDKGESDFSNTVTLIPSGINTAQAESAAIKVSKGHISVSNAGGKLIQISGIGGNTVFKAEGKNNITVALGAGCYAVTVGHKTAKVLVP